MMDLISNNQDLLKVKNGIINFFNLTKCCNLRIKDHIILMGGQDSFPRIIDIIRQYSNRPVICYTNEELNHFKWKSMIEKYEYIFLVLGSNTLIEHLQMLNID